MQNIKTKDFQKKLSDNGYEPVRQRGGHTIYEVKRTITDSLSVPTNDKTINGCLAKRLEKQIEDFMKR